MFDVLSVPLQHYANTLAHESLKQGKRDIELAQEALQQGRLALGQGHVGLEFNRAQLEMGDHAHRHDVTLLDEKVKQLESIASLSALIGGFEMVALVEFQLPDNLAHTHERLMVLFAATSALGVGTMLICMLISSYTLFRLLNFRSTFEQNKLPYFCIHGRNIPFDITVWEGRAHFKPAWIKAFRAFQIGVPCFMVNVIVLAWIKFADSLTSCVVTTVIISISVLYWLRFLAFTRVHTRSLNHLPLDVPICKESPSSMCMRTRPVCYECRKELRVGARWCYACGSNRVSQLQTCQCGHVLPSCAKFCDLCGTPRDGTLQNDSDFEPPSPTLGMPGSVPVAGFPGSPSPGQYTVLVGEGDGRAGGEGEGEGEGEGGSSEYSDSGSSPHAGELDQVAMVPP